MSHDQRPGKIRVVNAPPQLPARRFDDASNTAASAAAAARADANPKTRGGLGILGALLFLLGCAIGGAAAMAVLFR